MKYDDLLKQASQLPVVAHPYGEAITAGGRRFCNIIRQGESMNDQKKANCALIFHSVNKFPAVLDALRALARDDGGEPCFCGVSIGNPMMRGEHSSACIKARQALKDAEEVEVHG